LSEDNDFIKKLCAEGKTVAVYENGYITKKGEWKIQLNAPVTFLTLGGKAKFMIANVLAAMASYLWGFKTEDISLSLQTFIPVQHKNLDV
jgi:cyanophycin synthetase